MKGLIPTEAEGERLFFNEGQKMEIEITRPVRAALIMKTLSIRPHIEIVDFAPGVFRITAVKEDIPVRKLGFKVEILKRYKEKKKPGRYD